MNLFNLVNTDAGKRTKSSMPSSPARSVGKSVMRNKASMSPDLCDTSDVSTDTDDFSREEQLSVEAKLSRAKKRRERASRRLESVLNDKNEQAFQRAQKTIARRKEQSRKNNKKVKRVKERHSLQEKRRRSSTLRSIENRVNSALTRAKENLKRRQGRERKAKRIERAKNKRALIEFEKRSALLQSLGHRTERAARNLQLRLEDLQGKARDEIKHAQVIAKRVRAARIIQRSVRDKLVSTENYGSSSSALNAAAVKLQNCDAWRTKVVASRLSNDDKIRSFQALIAYFMDDSSDLPFEVITASISSVQNIAMVKTLLQALDPLLSSSSNQAISARTLLSVFLVTTQPDEVLGVKRGNDKCSILLEKAAFKLASLLHDFSNVDLPRDNIRKFVGVIHQMTSSIMSYCTLFDQWKNADLNDLVEKMTKSAVQSWIAYLTSKEALAYMEEEKALDQNVHFQHLLKHRSSKKGAGSHIKRVRVAMKRILGEKQGALVISETKAKAIAHIRDEKLMVTIRAEIDRAIDELTTPDESFAATTNLDQTKLVPENIQSNAKLVHQLLLLDSEDLDEMAKLGSKNFAHLDDVEGFMLQFKAHNVSQWIGENSTADGIKKLILDLMEKMRKLVPNRSDLHDLFTAKHANDCSTMNDFFSLVLNMADVMSKALESENSSVVTTEWHKITSMWVSSNVATENIPFGFECWRSYLIASLTFLIGKTDLCQMEIANFQIIRVAPIVQANGKDYETLHFQQRYGDFLTVQSMETFSATWNWVRRVCAKRYAGDDTLQLRKGFMDEILFTQQAIEIPEVLNLDIQNIQSIRERTRLSVISAALILVAGKVINVDLPRLSYDSLSPESKYYKEKIHSLLSSNLPLEIMVKEVSDSLVVFATDVYCKPLHQVQKQTLHRSTLSILKGSDPVFMLMDKRMKSVFQLAAEFNPDQSISQIPTEMKSGLKSTLRQSKKSDQYKDQFMSKIRKEASKLGFNFVQDNIVQATYEAHKVVSHCLDLYGEKLLKKMMEMLEENS